MIRFKGRLMPYDDYVRDHMRRPYDEPAESRDARRAAIFEAVEQQGWTVRWAAAWLLLLELMCSGRRGRACCHFCVSIPTISGRVPQAGLVCVVRLHHGSHPHCCKS